MEICMLDPLFSPYFGGTEKVVYEFGKRLAKKYGISILTSQIPGTSPYEEIEGMKVYRTPSIYLKNLPSFMPPPYTISPLLIRDLFERSDADIFHIHCRYFYYLGTLLSIKYFLRKKLLLTLHNAHPEGISLMTDSSAALYDTVWGNRIMENCDRIVAVSRYTKEVTVPSYLKHNAEVVYNGVDEKHFKPRKRSPIREKFVVGDAPVLLTNGRLVTQKGMYYLIEAFYSLKKDFKDAKLIIIGKGPLKDELGSQCFRLGLQGSVHFVTGIPEDELPLYYNAATLFVLPTLWEPSAVVLYEALASGKAIVATRVGGNPEIVNNKCGLLVPPRNSCELYNSMKLLLEDEKLRKKMEKSSRERAVENFTWDIAAKRYEGIYKDVLS
ncbi:MAG: glycosyltransferase family 4 protein [Candidatus Micrarchaeota archaeon]|nr:glycosyltransferase family 4 protein [Candidatus Micrarchaeota archaeon]